MNFQRRPLYYVLNERREPVPTRDIVKWGRFFEQMDKRRVAYTDLELCEVSTVFIGTDHRFVYLPQEDSRPVLFETMIFFQCGEGEALSEREQWRYCTWAEAEVGHMEIVELLRERIAALQASAESITAGALAQALHREPR